MLIIFELVSSLTKLKAPFVVFADVLTSAWRYAWYILLVLNQCLFNGSMNEQVSAFNTNDHLSDS